MPRCDVCGNDYASMSIDAWGRRHTVAARTVLKQHARKSQ